MSTDDKVQDIILSELSDIKATLTRIVENGCSKAASHERTEGNVDKLFERVRELERAQAEGRGKLAVAVAILTAAAGFFFEWLGRHIPA